MNYFVKWDHNRNGIETVSTAVFKRLIILEPKPIFHDHHRNLFKGCDFVDDLHIFDTVEHALPYTSIRSIPTRSKSKKMFDVVFILCSHTYLKFLDLYERVRKGFERAVIVLLDLACRIGCTYVADNFPFHGYCSCQDRPEDIVRCISNIAKGIPCMTPAGESLLVVDKNRNIIRSQENARTGMLYQLAPRQIECLRYYIVGESFEQISERLDLNVNYIKNIIYKTRTTLGVKNFCEISKLAREWGFIE